jgi:hypothetical protein
LDLPEKEKKTMATEAFDSWALVELMGHQRIAGRVTEAEIGGCKFVRVDVPETKDRPGMTKFLGPSSIYAITPMSEETARAVSSRIDPAPIQAYDAQRLVQMMNEAKPKELLPGEPLGRNVNGFDGDDEEEDEDADRP